ncbi:heterokaryon incompatibility protein-domain-containing protein [Hypoxylon rubiginosum]|uniref:Heterokaryon incompatibility protein-domain-containing protein n=1 Tax=Hypoxylon rubiginosum TaxID=110542 RepID=A0ACC0CIW1_9PEZI|nr:heterokaryon incompatibility protein-domain-containing protein [Hypoxylon rubiginosum]
MLAQQSILNLAYFLNHIESKATRIPHIRGGAHELLRSYLLSLWALVAVMRLINTRSGELHEFFGDQIPEYAILSHTWEKDEVSYHEWMNQSVSTKDKAGYKKIQGACKFANGQGLYWLWVDTNCIDKSSSAELSEAINSMFAWYRDANICYAYLQDVPSANDNKEDIAIAFGQSRWFSRGWTLQELLAPWKIEFYARDWSRLGTRSGKLKHLIAQTTGIETDFLLDRYSTPLEKASISKRMSWVSRRETTRTEDIAYCMLGIFNINMPLLYGEGMKAFNRLQEEIIKISTDHTIFCWTWNDIMPYGWGSMLAPSPDVFSDSGDFKETQPQNGVIPYSMTNAGLVIELPVIHSWSYIFVALNAIKGRETGSERACIPLRKIENSNRFERATFPYKPIHLRLAHKLPGLSTGREQHIFEYSGLMKSVIVRSFFDTVRRRAPGVSTLPLKATYNVLLIMDPLTPEVRIDGMLAPSFVPDSGITLYRRDQCTFMDQIDSRMASTIPLTSFYLDGCQLNAAIIRLGDLHKQHYNVLVAVKPASGAKGQDMWFCKVLPSDYAHKQELDDIVQSQEERRNDLSSDKKFGIELGRNLMFVHGQNLHALYLAGGRVNSD